MNAYNNKLPIKLGRFELGIVRRKVQQLIGRHGFRDQDRQQLEQELIARLLQGLRAFDPKQAHLNAFVTTVVERSVATIVRDQCAEKRDHRRISSLNAPVWLDDGSRTELGDTLDLGAIEARNGRETKSDQEQIELASDVTSCLEGLSPELRQLAESLKHKNVSQISRETGVPRTTLRERVEEIRQYFETAGMRDHL